MTVLDPEETMPAGLTRLLPLVAIVLAAIFAAIFFRDTLSLEALAMHRDTLLAWRDSHYLGAAIGFFALYVIVVALSLPGGLIMTLAGGFLFGPLIGGTLTVFAATIGAVAIFLAARHGLGAWLAQKAEKSPRFEAIRDGMRRDEVSYLLILRLVPVVPFFLANLAPALLGARLGVFAFTTFFGIMPATFIYATVGAGLGAVFAEGGKPDLGVIFEPHVLLALLGLAVLSALPAIVRRLRG